jgi:hypothetical protein
VCASVVLFLISKSINRLRKLKRNKYIFAHIEKLNRHKILVMVVPLIGPIVGFASVNGLEVGIPEEGLKVNDPGHSSSISDGE